MEENNQKYYGNNNKYRCHAGQKENERHRTYGKGRHNHGQHFDFKKWQSKSHPLFHPGSNLQSFKLPTWGYFRIQKIIKKQWVIYPLFFNL